MWARAYVTSTRISGRLLRACMRRPLWHGCRPETTPGHSGGPLSYRRTSIDDRNPSPPERVRTRIVRHRDGGFAWPCTAKSPHSPSMPLSSWTPRSSKAMPDPATRSTTVRETRTSPASARDETRCARCTAIPPTSSPRTSTSPVWSPARTSRPSWGAPAQMDWAQRMARAGPSNVARMPSPVVLTSRPGNGATRCEPSHRANRAVRARSGRRNGQPVQSNSRCR